MIFVILIIKIQCFTWNIKCG